MELTGLAGHEVRGGADLLPGGQPLLPLVLLQGSRTPPLHPSFVAITTLALAPPRVPVCCSYRRLPLLVGCIYGRHIKESGDGVELFSHPIYSGVKIENDLTFSDVARWRRSSEGNTRLILGPPEVVNRVSPSERFWNKDWRTLGSALVVLPTTFQLHLGGERDVVIQKLAVLDEG